jgi:hypothetical protein
MDAPSLYTMLDAGSLVGEKGDYVEHQSHVFQPANGISGLIQESPYNPGIDTAPVGPIHRSFKKLVFIRDNPLPRLGRAFAGERPTGKSGITAQCGTFLQNDDIFYAPFCRGQRSRQSGTTPAGDNEVGFEFLIFTT